MEEIQKECQEFNKDLEGYIKQLQPFSETYRTKENNIKSAIKKTRLIANIIVYCISAMFIFPMLLLYAAEHKIIEIDQVYIEFICIVAIAGIFIFSFLFVVTASYSAILAARLEKFTCESKNAYSTCISILENLVKQAQEIKKQIEFACSSPAASATLKDIMFRYDRVDVTCTKPFQTVAFIKIKPVDEGDEDCELLFLKSIYGLQYMNTAEEKVVLTRETKSMLEQIQGNIIQHRCTHLELFPSCNSFPHMNFCLPQCITKEDANNVQDVLNRLCEIIRDDIYIKKYKELLSKNDVDKMVLLLTEDNPDIEKWTKIYVDNKPEWMRHLNNGASLQSYLKSDWAEIQEYFQKKGNAGDDNLYGLLSETANILSPYAGEFAETIIGQDAENHLILLETSS